MSCSKFQTLCSRKLHKRVISTRHMDSQNEAIFGVGAFLRALESGTNKKKFSKLLFGQKLWRFI